MRLALDRLRPVLAAIGERGKGMLIEQLEKRRKAGRQFVDLLESAVDADSIRYLMERHRAIAPDALATLSSALARSCASDEERL